MHEQFLSVLHDEFVAAAAVPTTSIAAVASASDFAFSSLGTSGTSMNANDYFAVPMNFRLLLIFISFLLPYLAFLLILPGVREKRVASFVAITVQIGVGVLLMASLILPYWKVGDAIIVSQFNSHSRVRHEAHIGVNVGLESINITLKYLSTMNTNEKPLRGLYLNERYNMNGVEAMGRELQAAYRRGLPYPLLKVMEYFSLSQGAFAWGRHYRIAGYYAGATLWLSFAIWVLQCVLLALVPHHYSKAGIICGILVLVSDCVYVSNTPTTDVRIPFETKTSETVFLRLHYGSCIYMSFLAGVIALIFGAALSLLQFLRLYSISTCMSGYLDDTVGPKCHWSHNSIKSLMVIEKKKAANNGWTTMESSTSSSTTSASSSSSTNGDNTETYITDETASAGEMTPSTSGRATSEKLEKNRNSIGTPDSGLTTGKGLSSCENSTPSTPLAALKVINEQLKHDTKSLRDSGRSSDILRRRAATSPNFAGTNRWNLPPSVLHLPTLMNNNESNNNHLRFGRYMNTANSPNSLSASPKSLESKSGLPPLPTGSFKRSVNGFSMTNSPPVESSGFQSTRSSFSNCSLTAEDGIASRKASLATNAFRFTDDEEDAPRHKKNEKKSLKGSDQSHSFFGVPPVQF